MDSDSSKGFQFRVYMDQRNTDWIFDYIKELSLIFICVMAVLSYALKLLSYTLKS